MLNLWDPFYAAFRRHPHQHWEPMWELAPHSRFGGNIYGDMARMEDQMLRQLRDTSCQVINGQDKFGVQLDVRQYRPEEVEVKVHDEDSENAYLAISASHEERTDEHGYVSRQFNRRILVPKDVDVKSLQCIWSPDGVLSLMAPRKTLPTAEASQGRRIPITQGQQPVLKKSEEKE